MLVKIAKYIVFCVHGRSCLICPPPVLGNPFKFVSQSGFGDKLLIVIRYLVILWALCPQNGTAILAWLRRVSECCLCSY